MRNPNASQWNIGCVGSQTQISHVGHVHFIFFVSISFALASQFPVEYGLNDIQGTLDNGRPQLASIVGTLSRDRSGFRVGQLTTPPLHEGPHVAW